MRISRRDAVTGAGVLGVIALTRRAAAQAPAVPPRGTLTNADASPRTRALYRYLWSIYGKHTLTGQQESYWRPEGPTYELDYLEEKTGALPAVLGLDYIDPADFANLNARAIAWYERGGIPTICWHWGAPDKGTGYDNSKKPFDLKAALSDGTPQHAAMMRDLSQIADQLTVLRDADVPVLWRPLHEFSGEWFWWGQWGPTGFKALWTLIWEYFTRERGLNNLIWVLGWAGQNVAASYYPGRAYVDIAGADIYAPDHGPLAPMFGQVKAIVGDTVPICLHENGPVPKPELLGPKADWLWFMTWHTRWLTDAEFNTAEQLKADFASERYLTLAELPPLA